MTQLLLNNFVNIWIIYILLGVISGFIAGLLGLGGGIIVVPVLVLIFNYQNFPTETIMHMATNTSLAIMLFTITSVIIAQQRKKAINWPIVISSSWWLITGAVLGSCFSNSLSTVQLKLIFSIFIIYISIRALIKRNTFHQNALSSWIRTVATSFIGFSSSLLGIGGGALLVPLFLRNKLPIHQAIATSSACGLLIALAGTVFPILLNNFNTSTSISYIYWPAVVGLTLGSIPAAPLGTKLGHYLSEIQLKLIFFIVIIIASLIIIL